MGAKLTLTQSWELPLHIPTYATCIDTLCSNAYLCGGTKPTLTNFWELPQHMDTLCSNVFLWVRTTPTLSKFWDLPLHTPTCPKCPDALCSNANSKVGNNAHIDQVFGSTPCTPQHMLHCSFLGGNQVSMDQLVYGCKERIGQLAYHCTC